ncbi:hypothetical protein M6D93_01680 [Jatrophihabitans telluris]|uniref:Pilus assembly protein CpaE n=1 Tax=Jatrophihabitans telluris TaxID=2038343 RepID=A0ABY4R0P4_9ACTN|nr:hypothetical protein [Jatrophihabitans telluris]UQX88725.1 hypothetical protein M6D93_01680 [Jatrophihabitans telluris]
MISVELSTALRSAGLRWKPATGDRFVITQNEMAGEVFVLSDMTVEVHQLPQGAVIGFNGTTEWALDSVEDRHALWLPRETQLRELLAGTFRTLDRTSEGWRVRVEVGGAEAEFVDADPEQAYGGALLHLLSFIEV